jgi:RimJ/RimL family protein N-acetyltransferase
MFVGAHARGHGIGRQLFQPVIDYAHGKVKIIQLAVVSTNETAIRLYEKFGFREYGRELNAVKINDQYYHDIWMSLEL